MFSAEKTFFLLWSLVVWGLRGDGGQAQSKVNIAILIALTVLEIFADSIFIIDCFFPRRQGLWYKLSQICGPFLVSIFDKMYRDTSSTPQEKARRNKNFSHELYRIGSSHRNIFSFGEYFLETLKSSGIDARTRLRDGPGNILRSSDVQITDAIGSYE